LIGRIVLLSACFLSTAAYLHQASKVEPVPVRQSLAGFPTKIDEWQGQEAARLDEKILILLGVDDYLNRLYQAHGRPLIGLYIGYYKSQRAGHTFHSPMNCLPGSGWNPVTRGYVTIPIENTPTATSGIPYMEVNRVLIEKGLDRQLVFYWYQGHGRVVASEYRAKIYTVLDAIRMNRTDAALVRVIVPVRDAGLGSEKLAEREAMIFVKSIYPLLSTYLPV